MVGSIATLLFEKSLAIHKCTYNKRYDDGGNACQYVIVPQLTEHRATQLDWSATRLASSATCHAAHFLHSTYIYKALDRPVKRRAYAILPGTNGWPAERPPHTVHACPFTYDASSLPKKSATRAISSAIPPRMRGFS